MKIIEVFVEKKYMLALRIIFFLVSLYFYKEVYQILSTGVAISGRKIANIDVNSSNYYAILFKYVVFAVVFTCLTFFSVKEKKS